MVIKKIIATRSSRIVILYNLRGLNNIIHHCSHQDRIVGGLAELILFSLLSNFDLAKMFALVKSIIPPNFVTISQLL